MSNYCYIGDNDNINNIYGINRDYMNMSIYERNNLILTPNTYHEIDRPITTNDNRVNRVHINRLVTQPYKNGDRLIDRGNELIIQSGKTTLEKKSLNVLSEITIDSNIPLIPEMIDNLNSYTNIYNFSNIGINTRNLTANNLYIQKCVNNIKNLNIEIQKELNK